MMETKPEKYRTKSNIASSYDKVSSNSRVCIEQNYIHPKKLPGQSENHVPENTECLKTCLLFQGSNIKDKD